MYKSYVNVLSTVDGKYDEISTVDISTNEIIRGEEAFMGDKLASYSFISWRLKKLTGKILTIIDASIPEQKQNKAVKDIIKGIFFDEYTEVCDFLIDKSCLNPKDLSEVTEISTDEALGIK